MVYLRNLLCIYLLSLFALGAKSQSVGGISFKETEDSLTALMKQIYSDNSFSIKEEANFKFHSLFRAILDKEDAFNYPFDSLKHIGKIKSEDEKVRIFTWNLSQKDGYQKYYGFILYKKEKGSRNCITFDLTDNRKAIIDPTSNLLNQHCWMGTLYYSIFTKKNKGKIYYILLGFDFNDLFSSKKIIDVLTFDKDFQPIFGSGIFKVEDKILNRIVFEFSARAAMNLRYIAESETIVFDHLSPSKPDYSDNYQFYGPDFTFDGFKFDDGYWVYVRNLDLRNPRREPVKLKESPENYNEPSFLYKINKR